jgi:hypothetical protein
MLAKYSDLLERAGNAAEVRNNLKAGEAWLAAYDLVQFAHDHRVLDDEDLRIALDMARAGRFAPASGARMITALEKYRATRLAATAAV